MFPQKGEAVPKLRLAGFIGAWEQRKVSELFRVTRGYVLASSQTDTIKTDEMPYPVYSSQTKDKGLMGYYPGGQLRAESHRAGWRAFLAGRFSQKQGCCPAARDALDLAGTGRQVGGRRDLSGGVRPLALPLPGVRQQPSPRQDAAGGSDLTLSLVGHGKGHLLHKIRKFR